MTAPLGLLGYCTPSEAEGWGYYVMSPRWGCYDVAPPGLLFIFISISLLSGFFKHLFKKKGNAQSEHYLYKIYFLIQRTEYPFAL